MNGGHCTVSGCLDPVRCRGLCRLHYSRSLSGRPMDQPRQRRFHNAAERYDYFADRSAGPNECWPWQGHCSPDRYGMITLDDGSKGTPHRYAYERFVGAIPAGLVIRHRCDNKVCVNPAHLETGTQRENILDASERGQLPRGSVNHFARLREDDIPKIRALLGAGRPESQIAKSFGVSRGAINHIRRGNSWVHVPEEVD